MKKFFTSALVLALGASSFVAQAENKTVKDVASFKAFFESATRTATSADTLFVTADINVGNYSPTTGAAGRLVVVGVNKEDGSKPELKWGLNFPHNKEADAYALEFYNVKLAYRNGATDKSGQVFYDNKKVCFLDEISFYNCEITDIPRTLIRQVPASKELEDGTMFGLIKQVNVVDCDIHYNNISSGNAWRLIYLCAGIEGINFNGNVIYDMPYMTNLIGFGYFNENYMSKNDATINIKNNLIMATGPRTDILFDMSTYLGQNSQVYIENNIFMAPDWRNDYNLDWATTVVDSSTMETALAPRQIFRMQYGMPYMHNNVISAEYREQARGSWESDVQLDSVGEGAWLSELEDRVAPLKPEDLGLSWKSFTDAANGLIYLYKGDAWYTAGVDGAPLGPERIYTDTKMEIVNFSYKIEGSSSASISVSPVKGKYLKGDVVTVTVDDKGLNEIVSWSNGMEGKSNSITLEADLDLVITCKERDYYAIFNFDKCNGGKSNEKYESDFYKSPAPFVIRYATYDAETGVYADSIKDAIYTRTNKFESSNGVVKKCIVVRTKQLCDTTTGEMNQHPDYIYIDVPAINCGSEVSAYFGTDNFCYSKLNIDILVEGETEWTNIASDTLDYSKKANEVSSIGATEEKPANYEVSNTWKPIKAQIPASTIGKAYKLRFQGDVTSTPFIAIDQDAAGNTLENKKLFAEYLYIADIEFVLEEGGNAISNLAAEQKTAGVKKAIRNGRLVIETANGTYNVAGQLVK